MAIPSDSTKLNTVETQRKKNTFYLEVPWWSLTPNFSNPTQPKKNTTTKNCPKKNSDNPQKKNLPNLHTFFGGASTSDPCFVEGDKILSSTKSPPVARKALKDPVVGKLDLSGLAA